MTTIIFVILYLIMSVITTFVSMFCDRIAYGSYDPSVAYFGIGLAWPVMLPILLIYWIYKELKKIMITVIELIILWRDKK